MSPDIFEPWQRSRLMAGIRTRNTEPELALRRSLWAAGVRGWRCHRGDLPGRPDLAFSRAKLVVFVDGAFWHGHPSKFRPGASGRFWDEKVRRNQARDRAIDQDFEDLEWRVLRLWDFEILRQPEEAVRRVRDLLKG